MAAAEFDVLMIGRDAGQTAVLRSTKKLILFHNPNRNEALHIAHRGYTKFPQNAMNVWSNQKYERTKRVNSHVASRSKKPVRPPQNYQMHVIMQTQLALVSTLTNSYKAA